MDRAVEGTTREYVSSLSLEPGMVCADVGTGIGGVTRLLCQRVGPTGRVVATDLETKWLSELEEPNLEVRRANILTDPLGDSEFDFIHARALLSHLDPTVALSNMVRALRPGGLLVVGDPDLGTAGMAYPRIEALERYWEALTKLLAAAGGDAYTGRKLPHLLSTVGLVDIQARGLIFLSWTEDVYVSVFKHVAPIMVGSGLLSAEDVAAIQSLPRGTDSFSYGIAAIVASGRKPQDT